MYSKVVLKIHAQLQPQQQLQPELSLAIILFHTGCPKKNDTKNLVFFQKRSDTKWHEIIKTKCPTVWGVDFNKLKATQIPLKKTRAKRAVKNLTARLALVFLPGIIEQSAF